MAINMDALAQAAKGEPAAKVTVQKRWLAEVHRMLAAGAAAQLELEQMKTERRLHDSIDAIGAKIAGLAAGRPFGA